MHGIHWLRAVERYRLLFWQLAALALVLTTAPAVAVETAADDIPLHPDATLRSRESLGPDRLEVQAWILLAEGTDFNRVGDRGRAAAEEYVEQLQADGWNLRHENWQRRGGEFTFRKDVIHELKLSVGTAGKPIEGTMKPYVSMRYELRRLIPSVDLKGIDIPDAPRYPGSTRVRWMNILGDFAAKYLIAGSIDEVKSFYEQELPKHGWKPGRGVGTLNYTKGGAQSAEELSPEEKRVDRPLALVEGLIPSTLAVHLSEKDGIVDIGFGRSASAADLEGWDELPMDPVHEQPPPTDSAEVLTFIDSARDLPVYQGLLLEAERPEPMSTNGEEITRLLYKKEGTPADAIAAAEFYLTEMASRGWILVDEEWHGFGRRLAFRKGAVKVEIAVKAVGNLSRRDSPRPIPIPVDVRVILPVPTKETAGKDVEGVPRLPGSVRFYYLEVAISHTVKFKAVASKDEAEWFFIQELPKHGWSFAGNDFTGLLFVPRGTPKTASQAFARGQLIPTTLKVIVDDLWDGTLKVATALTEGDS